MMSQTNTLKAFAVLAVLTACGDAGNKSQLKDITDGLDQVIGSAREFWFFESQSDGLGVQEPGNVEGLNYFPISMPIGEEDFFWTGSSSILNNQNIAFSTSAYEDIQRSVPVLKNIRFGSGEFLNLHLFSESLNNQLDEARWFAEMEPTFVIKSLLPNAGNFTVELKFEVVCYRFDNPETLTIVPIQSQDTLQLKETVGRNLNAGANYFIPKMKLSNDNVGPFVKACIKQQGQIASQLQVALQGAVTGPLDVEFTGLKTNLVNYSVNN